MRGDWGEGGRLPVVLLRRRRRRWWHLGRYVRQVEGSAHHGDHVTDSHEQMHLTESLVDGHVMRAVDQWAQVVVAHFVADARRFLNGCLDGDETQQRWHHVQPNHQLQQEAQAQHEQLSGKIYANNAVIFVIVKLIYCNIIIVPVLCTILLGVQFA